MEGSQRDEIRVLGPLEIVIEQRTMALPALKERQLLAALLVAPGTTRSSDFLMDALWGSSPPPSAPSLLQVYVSKLRKALPGSVRIRTHGSGYALELADGVLDAARFERLLAEGRGAARAGNPALAASILRRALAVWRGQAYGDLAYEGFARGEAERLEELHLVASEERFAAELELGRHTELLPELRSLANANPLRERLQAQAMLALYRSGRQSEALDRYTVTRGRLHDELGLEPASELRDLQRRILQHDPALAATPEGTEETSASLPVSPNPLLGRERELRELGALLRRDEVRLLVLTGAGGSGKTRLAIEAARESAAAFANGVVLVELAPVRDPALLVPTIAEALGIQDATGESFEALVDAVRPNELLIVLDNAEHLRPATPCFTQLVAHAPHVTLLVTSRVVLHLSGEHVYPVYPLATDAAFELFVARAREADAGFEAGDADTETIRQICERLDGLPLAIELAATRVRSLSVAELLARLDVRLPVLIGGPRDLPSRQRTLRSTIEWSFDLLEHEGERRLLAALAVFVGGFTLRAVEEVCQAEIDDLSALVDANLVRRTGDRYLTLETIREFALEKLDVIGDSAVLHRRHAAYFTEFASTLNLYPEAIEARRAEGYDLALVEEANLRAALEWALAHDPELGLELAMALEQHWVSHNPAEGKRHFETLLARARGIPLPVRARALRCLGGSTELLGEIEPAAARYEESLALYTELGDEWGIVHLRHRLANCAVQRGESSKAGALYEENLVRARAGGFRFLEAEALGGLGWVAGHQGDLEAAWNLTRQHVAVVEEVGWPWGEAMGRIYMADLSLSLDRLDECEASARAGLVLARELDDRLNTVRALALLAARAGAAGETERAGRLWGAIEAEEVRGPIGRGEQHRTHADRALADRGDELERGLDTGRGMTLKEAVKYALEEKAGGHKPIR